MLETQGKLRTTKQRVCLLPTNQQKGANTNLAAQSQKLALSYRQAASCDCSAVPVWGEPVRLRRDQALRGLSRCRFSSAPLPLIENRKVKRATFASFTK